MMAERCHFRCLDWTDAYVVRVYGRWLAKRVLEWLRRRRRA